MSIALDQAKLAIKNNEIPVGCVFIKMISDSKYDIIA